MRVWLDSKPLTGGNAGRGVGTYARELQRSLEKYSDSIALVDSPSDADLWHHPFFDLFFPTLKPWSPRPRVVTVHDLIPLVLPKLYPLGIRGRLSWLYQKTVLENNVSSVITDSNCSKNDIMRLTKLPAEKISVVYLAGRGLPKLEQQLVESWRRRLQLPSRFALYIGDINLNKNLESLLMALTQVSNRIKLVVVSASFSNTDLIEAQRLAAILDKNNLRDRVLHLQIGSTDDEALAAVLQGAEILVQPSLYEGFGLPVVEAMQQGTLVVSTEGGSLVEVVGPGVFRVKPTVGDLASGLEWAWNASDVERKRRIRLNSEWVKQFSWDKTAQETIKVYEKVFSTSQH